jgi:uncharacterized phage-associated protein
MYFRFSTKKMIQAAAILLRQARDRMEYLRLLKLLYIADREHLRAFHRPIIGTRLVAMKNGPLHSEVYDLIKGEHIGEPLWSEYIRRDGYEVALLKDPGVSELSAAEVRTLAATSERHLDLSEFDLVEVTHGFSEWKENYPNVAESTSRTIPFDSLLAAVGLQGEKAAILEDIQEAARMDQLFPCLQ